MNGKRKPRACMVVLAFWATLATTFWGQGRGLGENAPLEFLKQELTKAGATALDANQESAIHSAITNFRNANRPAAPDAAEKAAADILAGNKDSAKTAADQLASLIALRRQARLEAALCIQVLPILRSDQMAALQKSAGKEVVPRLVTSLAGSGIGSGRGPMNSRPSGNQRWTY